MRFRWLTMALLTPTLLAAQAGRGPFARIAVLRAKDGNTREFEAGYIRHLDWHRQARDPWAWYGWSVTFGERQRWFVYATFGRSAGSLDSAVAPAEDERDNVRNVVPHGEFMGNVLYEYLPQLSRGSSDVGEPTPAARVEFMTVELFSGAAKAFEAAIGAGRSALTSETLWYRMVAGASAPRYVRIRPKPSLAAVIDGRSEQPVADSANQIVARTTVEVLTLRPAMSFGVVPPSGK